MKNSAEAEVEAIRKKRGPFVVAAESTRMPMIFTDPLGASNALSFANDSFLALTGFTKDQILGSPLSRILSEMTDPDTTTSIESALAAEDSGTWEMSCRRIDGTSFQASVFLNPVRNRAGVLCQNFLSFIPLGAGYDRLIKKRNEFHALYELAPGFIATSEGPNHLMTFANASFKRFVARDALEGITVAEALPEVVGQGFVELLDRVFRTGVPYRGTGVPFDIKDSGSGEVARRYADFVYQPVRDEQGAIVGLFCEGYDVTAQKETADSLAAVQAELIHVSRVNAMGTMAVTLAHELNQPLSAISNYTAGGLRLVDAVDGPVEPIAKALEAIDEATRRASDIIRTLRELTKRRDVDHTSFQLKPAVEECVRLVSAAAPADIEIVDLVPHDMTLAGDRIQIQQVIINLIRNASDAVMTSDRKIIKIMATAHDGEIVICVADTGSGVSLDAAQSIFSWTDSSKEGGMGLGLSISRTIVESHGGRIWLERSAGTGSELCFSIPAKAARSEGMADAMQGGEPA